MTIRNFYWICKGTITIDFSLKQIRIVEKNKENNQIHFLDLDNSEVEILSYCNDDKVLIRLLCDILRDNGFKINVRDLKNDR